MSLIVLVGPAASPLMAGLGLDPIWEGNAEQEGANYGNSVASAGDVNGDGYDDVIVGAYLYDDAFVNDGRALLYLGSAGDLLEGPVWSFTGGQAGAQVGWSVAAAGDVNGDGYGDVIVGADLYDKEGETDNGQAYLFLGSADGLAEQPAWTYIGQSGAHLGSQVASAGDVNGDGLDDVIVGADRYTSGQTFEGAALVFLGDEEPGLEPSPVWFVESNQEFAVYGTSVSGAGDVNGDGLDDVIVGAPQYDFDFAAEGRAFVYLGTMSGVDTSVFWAFSPGQANARLGRSVAGAGDVNGDGYDDVVVGAYNHNSIFFFHAGRAWVFHGGEGMSTSASWSSGGGQDSAFYGISVASAGDTNGDGYDDLLVGASLFNNGETDEGRTYLYVGSGTGLSTGPVWYQEGNQTGAQFGFSVASAGDVNGDSLADVVIGAPGYDQTGTPNGGMASVYKGTE